MTTHIEYDAGDYALSVEIDGTTHDLGRAATVGQGEAAINRFLIDFYLLHNTPEKAAELIMSNQYAGYA